MGRVPTTKEAAQKAVTYSEGIHQSRKDGKGFGFGRTPRSKTPDLFTTTLFAFHFKSAKVAGLIVSPTSFEGTISFLDATEVKAQHSFAWVPGGKPNTQAAIMGCASRMILGWKKEDLKETVTKAIKDYPGPTSDKPDSNVFFNYFATLITFQQGGQLWKDWNTKLKKSLVDAQKRSGVANGSWDPSGEWAGSGRVFSTVMNCLSLEIYYRYLPMYK